MNKTQMKNRCRIILDKYPYKTKIEDTEDDKFLNVLILGHKYKDEIIGSGISYFYVDSDGRGSRCFHIKRTDETTTNFGYNSCLENFSIEKIINSACRNSIIDIIIKYKSNYCFVDATCPFTGEEMTYENSDVDHYDSTFKELFDRWLENKDINLIYKSIIYKPYGMEILGEPYYSDFIKFHNNNTHLRLITKVANRSILKKNKKSNFNI